MGKQLANQESIKTIRQKVTYLLVVGKSSDP